MIKHKGFKFRIYPTEEQKDAIWNNIHSARFMYNRMLSDKIDYYNEFGEMLHNTPAQYKDDFDWLKSVDALALCNVQLNLDKAFKAYFRNQNDFPNFKKRHKVNWSYTTNVVGKNIRIEDGKIRLPKVGFVKIKQHRVYKGKIKAVTVSCSRTMKYYVSLICEYEEDEPIIKLDVNKSIGLDYSSAMLYVDDNDNMPDDYEKIFAKTSDKLAREQRKLSHMKLGSNNFRKQKLKIAKIDEHITNKRNDFLHKESTRIANLYDYVFVEGIDMLEIAAHKNKYHLGKATLDNSFGRFRDFLEYKLQDRGKVFHKLDKYYPSTKTCSRCGHKQSLDLKDRIYNCPVCGLSIGRDLNAAINIKNEGLKHFQTE